ncbi:glycosyltransferase family 87 protein [Bradyrhizobium sp. HKCCYLS1011]|uniref:glycosyltransferase family 87 protein n=1 Tax=Bradyrhizobium sp. HKCCYLS1011 TaxID=3420733 RepID=UPI003EBAF475
MTAASTAASRQQRDVRLFLILLIALCGYNGLYLVRWWLASPQPAFGDFFGFWSFGKFAASSGTAIYDPFALADYQHSLDPALDGGFPYPYPPTFLLVLIPLGMMTLPFAYLCWVLGTFALYVLATLGRSWRSIFGLALLAAPTTLIVAISGQNGFLSAALLIGGLRQLTSSPILGGALLGLLTYKPQFVLLLPVVLIASRNLAAILSAVATALLILVLTSATLDWSIWQQWIARFPSYQSLLRDNQASLDHLMPTMVAGMHAIGAPVIIGYTVQLLFSCVVIALTWRACRQGMTDRAIAMAAIGSVIATPYAMIYDMPMVTAAIAIRWKARADAGEPTPALEVALVIALFACALVMIGHSVPFAAATMAFLLFLRIARSPSDALSADHRPLPALNVAPPAAR